jgi:hypothetical protein
VATGTCPNKIKIPLLYGDGKFAVEVVGEGGGFRRQSPVSMDLLKKRQPLNIEFSIVLRNNGQVGKINY